MFEAFILGFWIIWSSGRNVRAVSEAVDIPVIASGGVGNVQHLIDGIKEGKADAVLAASIFHFGEVSIRDAKLAMREAGIEVRL